mgnify:CR=1 FL=1
MQNYKVIKAISSNCSFKINPSWIWIITNKEAESETFYNEVWIFLLHIDDSTENLTYLSDEEIIEANVLLSKVWEKIEPKLCGVPEYDNRFLK